jgi:hypothetical protein
MRLITILAGATYLWAIVMAAPGPGSHQSPKFHNSARHAGADPYVLYNSADGLYYTYSTEGADEGYNFAIYSSPDLSTWHKQPGGVLKACYDEEMNPIEGGQACWAKDWFWAPEVYHNEKTGWYFFFFAGRLREDLAKDYFRYSKFEEPSKLGVAVSRSPTGPFKEIKSEPISWYPFDPEYHDVNLIMDEEQMLPPQSLEQGQTAPKGTYIPTIDVNIFFDDDNTIKLFASRNAYRNWNWDSQLGKYIEESNIIVVEMAREWWDDPSASTMPTIAASQMDIHASDAPPLPANITSYNGTGEIGSPPRKDGWKTVISYGADPQEWENFHVDDYAKFNGTKKDRRWSEGSTLLKRGGKYYILYSANNFEASNYGVGFAVASSPMGPFKKAASNPVLSQIPAEGDLPPIYSTGHGSVIASPPGGPGDSKVGAQEVTLETPRGAELFYVHHARNDTESDRSLYTTRMSLDERTGVIEMHLTADDQLLPKNTYPIRLDAVQSAQGVVVKVSSAQGSSFDLMEGSNRVVAVPGDRVASRSSAGSEEGVFVLEFSGDVQEVAYQRVNVRGVWETVVTKKLCK